MRGEHSPIKKQSWSKWAAWHNEWKYKQNVTKNEILCEERMIVIKSPDRWLRIACEVIAGKGYFDMDTTQTYPSIKKEEEKGNLDVKLIFPTQFNYAPE